MKPDFKNDTDGLTAKESLYILIFILSQVMAYTALIYVIINLMNVL